MIPCASTSVHEHCRNCILKQCMETEECPVINCRLGCGMKLHECKATDHSFICQNQKVPCVNSYYGCPVVLPRSQVGKHIQHCPASIILCTMEWGRNPLYSDVRLKSVPFRQPNPTLVKGYLDVELALHDQKVINEMIQQQNKHGMVKKLPERETHDLSFDLSYKRANLFQDEIRKAPVIRNEFPAELEVPSRCLQNLKIIKLKESNRESSIEVDDNCIKNDETVGEDIGECPEITDTGLDLNLNIETMPKFGRNSYFYKVPCRQVLQRREYPAHFKNVHSEIHGGQGWMEQRCPMAQYGCPFVYHRLLPLTQEGCVVFSQDLGGFGVKPLKNVDVSPQSYLLDLPFELQAEICKWLDGFSLNNLMLTCRTLYHNLSHLLHKQGVVMARWKKRVYEDGSASWTLGKKV